MKPTLHTRVASYGFLGAAGHASDVLGVLEAIAMHGDDKLESVDLFADGEVDERRFFNRPARLAGVIADVRADSSIQWMVTAGYPLPRRALFSQVEHLNLGFATPVHPMATIGTGSELQPGAVVLAGAALSPRVRLGAHTVISQTTSVGHDSIIGAFSSVMPLACISGDCVLGEGVLVGSGAFVAEKVEVGAGATIGAGAVVLEDVAPGVTVVGTPARPMD